MFSCPRPDNLAIMAIKVDEGKELVKALILDDMLDIIFIANYFVTFFNGGKWKLVVTGSP